MMININFQTIAVLTLIVLNLQYKQVFCATIRGRVVDNGEDSFISNEEQHHGSVQRRVKKDKNEDAEDRNRYGNGNYIREDYPCVTVEELNAVGKRFLHPMDRNDPEENAILNANGDLVPPESCSCPSGCCRTYQWLVCDTEGYLPYIPCICNQNTNNHTGDPSQNLNTLMNNPSPFAGLTQPGSGFTLDRSIPSEPAVAAQSNLFSMSVQSGPTISGLPTQPANAQQPIVSNSGVSGSSSSNVATTSSLPTQPAISEQPIVSNSGASESAGSNGATILWSIISP